MNPQELVFIIKARNEARKNLKALEGNIKDLGRAAKTAQKGFGGADASIKKLRTQAKTAQQPLRGVQKALERINKQRVAGATKGVNNLSRAAKLAQGATSKLLGVITRFGAAFAAGFAGITLFQNAVTEVNKLEVSLAKIEGLVGVESDAIKGLSEAVRAVSVETGRSASELGEALFFITSAGLRGAEATEALRNAAKAATAGLGETKTIALALAASMNAYAREGLGASEATDILVKTVRLGNFETAAFAGALGQTLPILSAAGISLNDVGASVAVLTRVSGDAGTALNGLRSFVTALSKAGKDGQKVLDEYDLTFADLRDTLRKNGPLEAVRQLTDAVGDNEEALTDVLGRVEATTFVLSIMGQEAEVVDAIFEDMQDTLNTTQFAFEKVAATIQGRYDIAMARLIDITGQAVKQTIPALVGALEFLIDNIEDITRLIKILAVVTIGKLLVGAFVKMLALVGPQVIAFIQLAASVTSVSGAMSLLGAAMVGLPFVAIGAAIVALTFGLSKLGDNAKEAQAAIERMDRVGVELRDTLMRLREAGTDAGLALKEELADKFDATSKAIRDAKRELEAITDPGFLGKIGQSFRALGEFSFGFTSTETSDHKRAVALAERIDEYEHLQEAAIETSLRIAAEEKTAQQIIREAREAAELAAEKKREADAKEAASVKEIGKALDGLRKKFFPLIEAQRQYAEVSGFVNQAIARGPEFLAKYGLTVEMAREALAKFQEAQRKANDVVGNAAKKVQEQIDMIGLSTAAKAAATLSTQVLAQAEKKGIDVTEDQIDALEELAVARVKAASAAEFQRRVEDLQIEAAIAGVRRRQTSTGTVDDDGNFKVQAELIRRTEREQKRLTVAVKEYREALDKGFSEEDARARTELILRNMDAIEEAMKKAGENGAAGFKAAFQEIAQDGLTTFEFIRDLTKGVFEDMKGFIKDFVRTGEFDFAGFVSSINDRLLDMAVDSAFAQIAGMIFPDEASTPEEATRQAAEIYKQAVETTAKQVSDAQVSVADAVRQTQTNIDTLNNTMTQLGPAINNLAQATADAAAGVGGGGGLPGVPRRRPEIGGTTGGTTGGFDVGNDPGGLGPIAEASILTQESAQQFSQAADLFTTSLDGSFNTLISDMTGITGNFSGLFGTALDGIIGALSGGSGGSAGGGDFLGGILNIGLSFLEKGGVMTDKGPLPLKRYGTGGIADSPQVAMFGEGSQREAFVPLPDGRRIPVAIEGGGQSGPTRIVNVRNQMNITTTDADSFGRNQSQIERQLGRATRRTLARDD